MISFSQRDPKWANEKIGLTNLTIGRYGCTITCIADLATYFGESLTPADVNKKISTTRDGLIIWGSCNFEHFAFANRQYGRQDHDINTALQDPSRAVILQVANGSHWVVCIGYADALKSYRIADPWLGDRTFMSRYNNNITGAAYFRRQ